MQEQKLNGRSHSWCQNSSPIPIHFSPLCVEKAALEKCFATILINIHMIILPKGKSLSSAKLQSQSESRMQSSEYLFFFGFPKSANNSSCRYVFKTVLFTEYHKQLYQQQDTQVQYRLSISSSLVIDSFHFDTDDSSFIFMCKKKHEALTGLAAVVKNY